MLPRPSTTISFQPLASPRRSAWVTRLPSVSWRRSLASAPYTSSNRPSGSQSMQNGTGAGAFALTSALPSSSSASTSPAPQLESQSRPMPARRFTDDEPAAQRSRCIHDSVPPAASMTGFSPLHERLPARSTEEPAGDLGSGAGSVAAADLVRDQHAQHTTERDDCNLVSRNDYWRRASPIPPRLRPGAAGPPHGFGQLGEVDLGPLVAALLVGRQVAESHPVK
jgi:hypothetical protein